LKRSFSQSSNCHSAEPTASHTTVTSDCHTRLPHPSAASLTTHMVNDTMLLFVTLVLLSLSLCNTTSTSPGSQPSHYFSLFELLPYQYSPFSILCDYSPPSRILHTSIPRGGSDDPISAYPFPHQTTPVKDLHFPLSLTAFRSLLLSDAAPLGFSSYHAADGDSEFAMSEWRDNAREISYRHPLFNPLGPQSTRVVKTQNLTDFATKGFVIETKVQVLDVPSANSFAVYDCWKVTADDKGTSVNVTVMMDVRFTAWSPLKGVISSNSYGDGAKWFTSFLQRGLESL